MSIVLHFAEFNIRTSYMTMGQWAMLTQGAGKRNIPNKRLQKIRCTNMQCILCTEWKSTHTFKRSFLWFSLFYSYFSKDLQLHQTLYVYTVCVLEKRLDFAILCNECRTSSQNDHRFNRFNSNQIFQGINTRTVNTFTRTRSVYSVYGFTLHRLTSKKSLKIIEAN